MSKYRAAKWTEKDTGREHWYIERTSPAYGWPGVEIPSGQPRDMTESQARAYAAKMNGEGPATYEQMDLLKEIQK